MVSDDQNLLSRLDDDLLKSAAILAEDNIDGVRINVARFVGVICGKERPNAFKMEIDIFCFI